MALDRGGAERGALGGQLLRLVLVLAVVAVVVVAAGLAFGWSLTQGPSFDIVPDPAGDLPF